MRSRSGVWGIDLGCCALKALRCEYDDQSEQLIATAFDYIEHRQILSWPDSHPEELVREAIKGFCKRHRAKGDVVAISLPSSSGLLRFFERPPIERGRLEWFASCEARQAIPFSLDEVVWDCQLMPGVHEAYGPPRGIHDGEVKRAVRNPKKLPLLLLGCQSCLVAFKRDQLEIALRPFREAGIKPKIIQLAAVSLYNLVAYSLVAKDFHGKVYDDEDPAPSYVILSLNTDTTNFVTTNGFRAWERNMPVGGNHFTQHLAHEGNLTLAAAERMKCGLVETVDKDSLSTFRPVLDALLTEVQRSIGFFQSIERKARIEGLILFGNASRLPGFQPFVAQHLGLRLVDLQDAAWPWRTEQATFTAPQFQQNLSSFAVCYGLCLQGLGLAPLNANLLPKRGFWGAFAAARRSFWPRPEHD